MAAELGPAQPQLVVVFVVVGLVFCVVVVVIVGPRNLMLNDPRHRRRGYEQVKKQAKLLHLILILIFKLNCVSNICKLLVHRCK